MAPDPGEKHKGGNDEEHDSSCMILGTASKNQEADADYGRDAAPAKTVNQPDLEKIRRRVFGMNVVKVDYFVFRGLWCRKIICHLSVPHLIGEM